MPRRLLLAVVLVVLPGLTHGAQAPDPAGAERAAQIDALLVRIRNGPPGKRSDAMHALSDHVRYRGAADRTTAILAAVREVGLASDDPEMRGRAYDVLQALKTPDALPLLTAGLADPSADVRSEACDGLRDLGPAAKTAVPELRLLLADKAVADDAISALSYILGPGPRPTRS